MPAKVITVDGQLVLVDEGVLMEAATAEAPASQEPETPSGEGASDPGSTSPTDSGTPAPDGQAPSERSTSVKPSDVSWHEWQRRQDVVRTLAREFDDLDHGDIREFIEGRTNRELTDEEIGQIKHDITAQRVSDITDVLDEQLRSTSERMKRSRRTVRVQAPRGWVRRVFNALDERAVEQVAARLIQRGHEPDVIKEKVISRMSDEEARQALEDRIDNEELEIKFSSGGFIESSSGDVPVMIDNSYIITSAQIDVLAERIAERLGSEQED